MDEVESVIETLLCPLCSWLVLSQLSFILLLQAGYKNLATSCFYGFARIPQLAMASIVHPLLSLLASLTRQQLARQVAYLKAENQMLRSKLPNRISLSDKERRTLIKHGNKLGARIKEIISIVSYSTFRRWIRQWKIRLAREPRRLPSMDALESKRALARQSSASAKRPDGATPR